ncbi:hypothetical protein DM02DRAFT_686603 [Periconia macrospinosa]|uniref:STAS domain-containing protein n=1 Tax=Periconia macrospinosa TaxID=97972 RepID=A0A2V1DFQ6_9PLEO|nr:hypothetical protein DM02DRAFT_686603 [Periconia macrospinosa]
MEYLRRVGEAISTDRTIQRARRDSVRVARALPRATGDYIIEKAPVVQWAPRYQPRWLLYDALAGITIGVLLIPQALAYAKIATIPGQYGLMSSWLPNFLYFIMGTSKDMSTGPTSLMGLLTAEIIRDFTKEGFSPQSIASTTAMCVGIWCLVVGLFKLGFLLEFVSIPVLNGFISAAGIVIMLGQIPSLFGVKVGSGTGTIIHDLFAQIPDFDGPTTGVGLGGIVLLVLLQKVGERWGKKYKALWLIGLARSAIVLILFTGMSYGLNKNRVNDPIFELSKVKSDGINSPVMPPTDLIPKVFPRAVAPFLAATIEHLAIAKGFARRNNYVIDPAQELVYLGVTNFFNSFFSSMPVGGAMSRTAVNSATGVKSPAYGLIAGGFVVLAIFELSPALFWIPKATLASIIVLAVWSILTSPKVFYHYWKTSLVDFTASMLAFWVTLFVSTEVGIGAAVGFQLAYHILYTTFSRVRHLTVFPPTPPSSYILNRAPTPTGSISPSSSSNSPSVLPTHPTIPIPASIPVFRPHVPLIFFNAFSLKSQLWDAIQTYTSSPLPSSTTSSSTRAKDRNWSTAGERRARHLRSRAGVPSDPDAIRGVVVDMGMVPCIDTTGIVALRDLRDDLRAYAGEGVEVRLVGVKDAVRERFERFGWGLVRAGRRGEGEEGKDEGGMGSVDERRVVVLRVEGEKGEKGDEKV